MIAWELTRDYIAEEYRERPSLPGINVDYLSNAIPVRLYDDDGILYWEGRSIDAEDSLEHLFAWAMRDSGVTRLDVKRDGEWNGEIA
jgi:hypothetical protein